MANRYNQYELGSNQYKKVPKQNPHASTDSRSRARGARNGIRAAAQDSTLGGFDGTQNAGNSSLPSGGISSTRSMSALRTFGEAGEYLANKPVPVAQSVGYQKWSVVAAPATMAAASRAVQDFSYVGVPFKNDTLTSVFAGVS